LHYEKQIDLGKIIERWLFMLYDVIGSNEQGIFKGFNGMERILNQMWALYFK
jgi:hypothetical protein